MKGYAANSTKMLWRMLLAFVLISTLLFSNQLTHAQKVPDSSKSAQTTQQPGAQPSGHDADQNTEQQTFTGVIAKSGDKLVLTDPLTKTIYQLDDQRKAQELVNKNVKVTGVLDPSTGTIRVSAIDPL